MTNKPDRAGFGPNTWLIEEMRQRYAQDPSTVGEAWREFFDDSKPPAPAKKTPPKPVDPDLAALKGADAVIADRMEESITVPTATSVRTLPARLLEVNRQILNNHLSRSKGGKVSFTHLIGWAIVKALAKTPGMNVSYRRHDDKPHVVNQSHINLGLAVDVQRRDGTRTLMVPNIKSAEELTFSEFLTSYEDMVRKTNEGKLSPDDFSSTTHTITNPGMIGTSMSVPRLMADQSAILGVGAIDYPAEYKAADRRTLADIGVGKVVTITSTYDHRVIQGALSGEFLRTLESLLLGEDRFYDDVFESMGVPYVSVKWNEDRNPQTDTDEWEDKQSRVMSLINLYRVRGHLIADLDPLDTNPPQMHPELDPATHGLTIWDLDREFIAGGLAGKSKLRLGEILQILRDAYCRTGSIEYMHISDPGQKKWIQERVEGISWDVPAEVLRHILRKLNQAEAFETFLHKKYVGHKRFSLEGAEALIPMLDAVLENAANTGMEETVIGMSHRGRLNVLANIVGKSFTQIFREFEGDLDPESAQGSGDVKYHIGATGKFVTEEGSEMGVTVASNPSHLESVDPVVQGMVRAKQDLLDRRDEIPVLPVLLHGDAAFAGQGVVAETLNLSALAGYGTGGTIHIIVNNQLGFTTGASYGRSSTYASDVAKMVQAPIFHVNGEDPEACVRAAELAFQFRQEFKKDVVIDMWCYRRWGHNEADEPAFTQPLMYARIEGRRSIRKLYTEALVNRGDLPVDEAEELLEEFRSQLQRAFDETREAGEPGKTGKFLKPVPPPTIDTAVSREVLDEVLTGITTVPGDFDLHPKLAKWLDERKKALAEDAIDWSLGEALSIGSILLDGVIVRLSGQDTRRGTFSQRHSTLVDQSTGEEYVPLQNLREDQARFFVIDSLLSEFAAVGFEYGYSVGNPDALVMWEAQFGDFVNGAQVIIDQFISAAEDKWAQKSGLVMLLPHGYEGQGPEHSSGRLERFLQLAAEENIQVAVPSTPAQYFHLLRRQAHLGDQRRPLIVLTPKSFLRLPAARSAAADFTGGTFRPLIEDPLDAAGVNRLIFCSGKVYYDLLKHRDGAGLGDVALVRVEQLYPFPAEEIKAVVESHPNADTLWVQEEPENMGAWRFVRLAFKDQLGLELNGVFRTESASTATGSASAHQWEQEKLISAAFASVPTGKKKKAAS